MKLVKEPAPLPSTVLSSAVVGFSLVLQQTPRAVTGEVPSFVTVPPLVAEVCVISVIAVVVTVGGVPADGIS